MVKSRCKLSTSFFYFLPKHASLEACFSQSSNVFLKAERESPRKPSFCDLLLFTRGWSNLSPSSPLWKCISLMARQGLGLQECYLIAKKSGQGWYGLTFFSRKGHLFRYSMSREETKDLFPAPLFPGTLPKEQSTSQPKKALLWILLPFELLHVADGREQPLFHSWMALCLMSALKLHCLSLEIHQDSPKNCFFSFWL